MTEPHEIKRIVDRKIESGEEAPQILKRCPKCQQLSLTYDSESGKMKCSKCGYEKTVTIK